MTVARATCRVYLTLLISAGVCAAATAITFPGGARRALGFRFTGVPSEPTAAAAILANNARLAALPLAFAIVLSWLMRVPMTRRRFSAMRLTMDGIVGALVTLNVALVGVAVGAYRARMIAALLPHGPVEVGAYAAALAVYLRARIGAAEPATVLATAAGCLLALTAAAALETWVRA